MNHCDIKDRDRLIIDEIRAGTPTELIGARFKLSAGRVRHIAKKYCYSVRTREPRHAAPVLDGTHEIQKVYHAEPDDLSPAQWWQMEKARVAQVRELVAMIPSRQGPRKVKS